MITSVQNERVKQWRKLQVKKERTKANMFFVESFHLVETACQSNYEVVEIIVRNDIKIPEFCAGYPITSVSDSVFSHISQTKTPQGIAAIVSMKSIKQHLGDYVLLIDAVQDPGNLGTIIRTADAAGFDSVVLGDGTVDPYNDKVIRATQGSIFHTQVINANLFEKVRSLKDAGYSILATGLTDAEDYRHTTHSQKTALILGNEGAGVQNDILQLADKVVKIPIYGKAESLNVSVAAGILMYYLKV